MKHRRITPTARKRATIRARRSRDTASVIDIHAHFVPEEYLRLIESDGEPHGLRLRPTPTGPLIMIGQAPVGPITATYYNLDLRLKEMDAQGIGIHALSLMPPMVYWGNGALGLRLARLVNEAMIGVRRIHPDPFVVFAALPMHNPGLAVMAAVRALTPPAFPRALCGRHNPRCVA